MSFNGETINADSVVVDNTNIVTGRLLPVDDFDIYVNSTGDDTNDGSASAPFATLGRAFELIAATGYNNTATITLASNLTITGNLSLPFIKAGQQINPIRVIGAQPTTTYTSAGNTTYSFDGNVDTRTAGALRGEDASKLLYVNDTDGSFNISNTLGRFARFTSGNLSAFQNNDQASANPVIAPIRETNDAQTLILDFFTTDNRPSAGDDYEIVELSTTLTFTDTLLTYGSNIIFENCIFVVNTATGLGLKTIAVDDMSTLTFNKCVFNCSANLIFDSAVNFGVNVISDSLVQSITSGVHFISLSANEITFNKNTKINYSNFTGTTTNDIIVNNADLSLFSVSFIDCQNIEITGSEVEADSIYYGNVKQLILRKTNMMTNGLTNHGSVPDAGNSAILVTDNSYLLVTVKRNGEFVETPKNINIISEVSCMRIEEFSTVYFDNIDNTTVASDYVITVTNGTAGDANINVIDSKFNMVIGYNQPQGSSIVTKSVYMQGFNTDLINAISSSVTVRQVNGAVLYFDNTNNVPMNIFDMINSKLLYEIETISTTVFNGFSITVSANDTITNTMNINFFNLDKSEATLDLAKGGLSFFSFRENLDNFVNCTNESIVFFNSGSTNGFVFDIIGSIRLDNSQFIIKEQSFNLNDTFTTTNPNALFIARNNSKLIFDNVLSTRIYNYATAFDFIDSEIIYRRNIFPRATITLERVTGPIACSFVNCKIDINYLELFGDDVLGDVFFTNCTGNMGTLDSRTDNTLISTTTFSGCNMNIDIVDGMNMVINNGSSMYIRENFHSRISSPSYLTLTDGSSLVLDNISANFVPNNLPFYVCNGGSSFTLIGSILSDFTTPSNAGVLFNFTDCKSVYMNNVTMNTTTTGISLDSVHQFNLNNITVNNSTAAAIIINRSRGNLTNVSGTGNVTGLLISNNSTVAADLATNITGTTELVVGTNPASTWATIQGGAVDDITDMGSLGSAPRQNCTLTAI